MKNELEMECLRLVSILNIILVSNILRNDVIPTLIGILSASHGQFITEQMHWQHAEQGSCEFIQRNRDLNHMGCQALDSSCYVICNHNRWGVDHRRGRQKIQNPAAGIALRYDKK